MYRKTVGIILICVAGLLFICPNASAQEQENRAVKFFKNLVNWPFGITKKTSEAVGQTTKAATDTATITETRTITETPTETPTTTPTATVTETVTPNPELVIQMYHCKSSPGWGFTTQSYGVIYLNGSGVTDATVTVKNISKSQGPVTVPHEGGSGHYKLNDGLDYYPGDMYEFVINMGGIILSSQVTAPGNVGISDYDVSTGVECTWAVNGNSTGTAYLQYDGEIVTGYPDYAASGVSPYLFPAENFAGSGEYLVYISVNSVESVYGSSNANTRVGAYERNTKTTTKP